ncbi:flagellin [Pseudomonas fragi]|uniref:flagellin N-terminal helical domain-containing protein n=1 Tax=Pseudomonas fragi TaxID=296 RepID=UPI000BA26D6A|nr:flagellin [Pseudomonas fragi]MBM1201656.1 flagellin [Pseudomonas fragi]NNB02757.1 flagellin [Pseudomonas fragi]NNB16866.1 flagellin [Pseudomonas fragi]NNB18664.1 flagellin [Pseudomonas fragi]NNB53998.1 flagellin [Pseudomonas fragi]
MALSVNTNVTSQTVQKNLNKAGDSLSTSMTRLSSGLKINSAKDDAAGMQIANRLTSQTKGMTVAIANANNGSSIAQTAEGAMQESTNILQRLRELALQSANGDKSDADRASLQQEFTAKTGELTRIAQTTTYGGRNILDGSFTNQSFQVGADANQTISFGMTDISATGLKGSYSEATTSGTALTGLTATTTGSALNVISATVVGGTAPAITAAGDKLTINGEEITLTGAAAGAAGGTQAATDINAKTADTGVKAVADAAGKLTLTSVDGSAIDLVDAGGGGLAKLGLSEGTTAAVDTGVAKKGTDAIGAAGEISVNGNAVKWDAADTVATVLGKFAGQAGAGSTATITDGRVVITSGAGKDIKLSNTDGGSLAKLGLSAGTSQAKLKEDTSIELNGVEVKFKKGDTTDTIVSSINSASTGVTASKNDDGTLKLFSNKDITIKDGAAGTGLKDLGLTTSAATTTKATTVETTVSDLSILSAADSQRTVQALADAIQQIDTQRSALGAVQNRFTSTVANLQSISENSTAALGRVQDTDFASEAAELTKQQTLQQASTAILSQANQLPSAVMKLLQ